MSNLGAVLIDERSECDSWSLISHDESVAGSMSSFAIVDNHDFDVKSIASDCFASDASSEQSIMQIKKESSKIKYTPPSVLRRPDWWYYGKVQKKTEPDSPIECQDFSLQELSFIHNELLQTYEDKYSLLDSLRSKFLFETSLGVVNLERYESFKTQLHEACLRQLFPPDSARILWELYPERRKQALVEDKINIKILRQLLSIPIHLETRFIAQINCEQHWKLLQSSPYKLIFAFGQKSLGHGPDEWECPMCTIVNSRSQEQCKVCELGKRWYAVAPPLHHRTDFHKC